MELHWLDWAIILVYMVAMIWIGFAYAKRAESSVEEFYVSGRNLTWWLAGTSMVATTFSADTPLVIGGWVRDFGIWKNWAWWCYAVSGLLTAFLFARYWRRLGVLTSAELAEHRYGDSEAKLLRGMFAFFQAAIGNVCVLAWVLLASYKIMDVLFDVGRGPAIAIACIVTLVYSLMSGFWGVVVTDFVQFIVAIGGAIVLGFISWNAIGGAGAIHSAIDSGVIPHDVIRFMPTSGPGSVFDASFWTPAIAAFCVYMGVSWWAAESVDGGSFVIQRIVACKDERHGVLAQLWYNIAHHALRPWPWIVVALGSLIVFPAIEIKAPLAGKVVAIADTRIQVESADHVVHDIEIKGNIDASNQIADDEHRKKTANIWRPIVNHDLKVGDSVAVGDVVAKTDSERAYPAMLTKFLPPGWLGLVLASLLAALMSTIDTHVILASSYVVNDLYRRFLVKGKSDAHYVFVGRVAACVVMGLAAVVAWSADSISGLFFFALALLAGIGPAYVLRWIWWRVRARTEIAALVTSFTTTFLLNHFNHAIQIHALQKADGALSDEGRILIVALTSLCVAALVTWMSQSPDPKSLVSFYEKVRPIGFWGPVRALTSARPQHGELAHVVLGTLTSFAAIFGLMFGLGYWILYGLATAWPGLVVCVIGAVGMAHFTNALTGKAAVAARNANGNLSP